MIHQKKIKKMGKTYEKIEKEAKRLGVSIRELSRKAGIHYQTLSKWRIKEPETLTVLEKIENALKQIQEDNFNNMVKRTGNENIE